MTSVRVGWCATDVEQELQLKLASTSLHLRDVRLFGASTAMLRQRLASLSDRFTGEHAVATRAQGVPSAYRVFFRHVGLDPDRALTPLDAALRDRFVDGCFVSQGLLADALLVALLDTGVPVWALASDSIEGSLGIREGHSGEQLGRGRGATRLCGGELLVADSASALAVLFDEPAQAHRPSERCSELTLYCLQVPGVPWLSVDEALWICRSTLLLGG